MWVGKDQGGAGGGQGEAAKSLRAQPFDAQKLCKGTLKGDDEEGERMGDEERVGRKAIAPASLLHSLSSLACWAVERGE